MSTKPQRKTRSLRRHLTIITVAVLLGSSASADLLVTERRQTDATEIAGQAQPAADTVVRYWFGKDKVRRQDGATTILLRFDRQRMFLVDEDNRSITEVALPIDLASLVPDEMRATLDMMLSDMAMQASVTPTEVRRAIGSWQARRYDVEMSNASGMAMQITMWVSKELPLDTSLFQRSVEALMALVPGSESWIGELLSIDGIPVERETVLEIMGSRIRTVERIESVEEVTVPPGHYDPPEGYEARPFDLAEAMQRATR